MVKKILSIIITSFIALSMAISWQAFAELNEIDLLAHLASYSDHHDDDDVSHFISDHQKSHSAAHTHEHQHGPNEPRHEHAHTDPGFVNSVASASLPQGSLLSAHHLSPTLEMRMNLSDRLPTSQEVSALFRPPIC